MHQTPLELKISELLKQNPDGHIEMIQQIAQDLDTQQRNADKRRDWNQFCALGDAIQIIMELVPKNKSKKQEGLVKRLSVRILKSHFKNGFDSKIHTSSEREFFNRFS